MPKKLRPAVDLMAFKCRTLKVKEYLRVNFREIEEGNTKIEMAGRCGEGSAGDEG
jgi:hypothetical protein